MDPQVTPRDDAALAVTRNDDEARYELHRDGEPIGFADYRETSDAVVVPYVEIRSDLRGRGFGDVLARGLLEDLQAGERQVVPRCGFLAGFIRDHPEFHHLVG